jgi:hypothetical protein
MGVKLKPLDLDFVRARPSAPWAGKLLLALAVAFAGDVAFSYARTASALKKNEAALARYETRKSQPLKSVSKEEMTAARETVTRLSTPWASLFGALESAASDKVALLGIEPDPKAGTVLITGDSKDYLAALTYVLNLARSEALGKVQMVRHEVKANEPQKPIGFAVSATWGGSK